VRERGDMGLGASELGHRGGRLRWVRAAFAERHVGLEGRREFLGLCGYLCASNSVGEMVEYS
jgi:hypothetical protein